MPPAQPRPVTACHTCRQFYQSSLSKDNIVTCASCAKKVSAILRTGYLSTLDLTVEDLFDTRVEVGDEATVIPHYVVFRASQPVESVNIRAENEDLLGSAVSHFKSQGTTDIIVFSISDQLPKTLLDELLRPFLTGDGLKQRRMASSIAWKPCHHCLTHFPQWEGSKWHRGADRNKVFFCSESCRNMFATCSHCSNVFNTMQLRSVSGGRMNLEGPMRLCEHCYEATQIPCHSCGTLISQYDMREFPPSGRRPDTRSGLRAILEDVEDEDEDEPPSPPRPTLRREPSPTPTIHVCEDCFQRSIVECDHCHNPGSSYEYRTVRNAETNEVDLTLCARCYQQWESRIHRHDYRPRQFRLYGSPPFYGIEVEVDNFPNDAHRYSRRIHDLSENEKFFYIKRDGSLNNGFELLWHPRSMTSWADAWYKVERILTLIHQEGASAFQAGTCGFHIHRSNGDLNKSAEVKLCLLLKLFKAKLIKVAQRRSDRFANFEVFDSYLTQPGQHVRREADLGFKQFKLQGWNVVKNRRHLRNRYQCINFGSNRDTIEFRIFKGSLFSPTLRAYMGFTHNLVEFTNTLLINEIDKHPDCKRCPKSSSHRNCQVCQEENLWARFVTFLYKRNKQPFVNDCLDFLHRHQLGHEDWVPFTTDWKEV